MHLNAMLVIRARGVLIYLFIIKVVSAWIIFATNCELQYPQ